MKTKNTINKISAIVLLIFAFVTLFMSSSVIFDWFGIRAKEGNYVLFIVWTNLISGLLYVAAAYYFFKNKKSAFSILLFVLILLVIAFIALQIHINNDGIYELKTVKAMIFRMTVTFTFSVIAWFTLNKSK
jgi:magnesium-transporting ATPase (P-type)